MFSALHTLDAVETVTRIIAQFPPHQQAQVRVQLASVLKAVISQRLLPRADGKGRAAAVEVMVSTPAIRDHIVHEHKTAAIHRAIAEGASQHGMQTFDQANFGAAGSAARDARGGAPVDVHGGCIRATGCDP